jgi:hypothetical protein
MATTSATAVRARPHGRSGWSDGGAAAAQALVEGLRWNQTVQRLSITSNGIGSAAASALMVQHPCAMGCRSGLTSGSVCAGCCQ